MLDSQIRDMERVRRLAWAGFKRDVPPESIEKTGGEVMAKALFNYAFAKGYDYGIRGRQSPVEHPLTPGKKGSAK